MDLILSLVVRPQLPFVLPSRQKRFFSVFQLLGMSSTTKRLGRHDHRRLSRAHSKLLVAAMAFASSGKATQVVPLGICGGPESSCRTLAWLACLPTLLSRNMAFTLVHQPGGKGMTGERGKAATALQQLILGEWILLSKARGGPEFRGV